MKTIGILAALHDEIAVLLQEMGEDVTIHRIGRREYHEGRLHGRRCIVVLARIGKVAAAATTVTLIREFKVSEILFTGLAGAVTPRVRVGDVVVASSLLQHDLDASPIFPQYEVPLLDRSEFSADATLAGCLLDCARSYLDRDFEDDIAEAARVQFALHAPAVHHGLIVSGDQFINEGSRVEALRRSLPAALCVEMEGAAVAQICYEYGVPFAVLRTISDSADNTASADFRAFLDQVARYYSAGIVRRFLAAGVAAASETGPGLLDKETSRPRLG